MYTFVVALLTLGIYGVYLSLSRWRQAAFWRHVLVFCALCGLVSLVRVYPMIADTSVYQEGLRGYGYGLARSHDVLRYFIPTRNPITEDWLRALFRSLRRRNTTTATWATSISSCLAARSFIFRAGRRLLPWLGHSALFRALRLGDYLTVHGVEHRNIVLPEGVLSDWFPAVFGAINWLDYYQPGLIVPLAALACFGLAAVLKSRPVSVRAAAALAAIVILSLEFYAPRYGRVIRSETADYIEWLRTESNEAIKLINLPLIDVGNPHYFLYMQTLTGYPQADGFSSRNPQAGRQYINGNLLLRRWDKSRSVHCLPHNERAYLSALDQLLEDGFSHVAVHNWRYGDQFINHSFQGVSPAYDDGFVSVYRLNDMRESCERLSIRPSRFSHFAASPTAIPGARSSILSFHPNASLDDESLAYLDSLFSDWRSLLHLYQADGEWTIQKSGEPISDVDGFASDNQVITVIYNSREADRALLDDFAPLAGYELCQSEAHEDGSVIEHYLNRAFSCALLTDDETLQVDYDNGARLSNLLVEIGQEFVDVQVMWSGLPEESHAISLQVFDGAGAKVLSQDATIGSNSLARHSLDISSLAPGGYAVKLIVYNFHTGKSAPGRLSDGGSFERALEIAAFDRK